MGTTNFPKQGAPQMWIGTVMTPTSGTTGYFSASVDYSSAGFSSPPVVFAQVDHETYAQNGAVVVYAINENSCNVRSLNGGLRVRILAIGT